MVHMCPEDNLSEWVFSLHFYVDSIGQLMWSIWLVQQVLLHTEPEYLAIITSSKCVIHKHLTQMESNELYRSL